MKFILLSVLAVAINIANGQNPYHVPDFHLQYQSLDSIPYFYDYDWYYATYDYENLYQYDYLHKGQLHSFMKELPCKEKLGVAEQWPDFGCEGIKVQRAHQPTSQCQGKKNNFGKLDMVQHYIKFIQLKYFCKIFCNYLICYLI
eukprot:TRINITY_DN9489_c0_g1_i8.p4 TRINITY_DN9489_c0_g1~~TRINITY_DN9489_c0_g1_i8.p4  ORF type:complete len:144 (+),score=10.52 TRINITY_DN9489_c0_g1_i8:117-548(+)